MQTHQKEQSRLREILTHFQPFLVVLAAVDSNMLIRIQAGKKYPDTASGVIAVSSANHNKSTTWKTKGDCGSG